MIGIGIWKFSTLSRYLLICFLDLFVYVTQLHVCTNLCLLCSDVVHYFLGQ